MQSLPKLTIQWVFKYFQYNVNVGSCRNVIYLHSTLKINLKFTYFKPEPHNMLTQNAGELLGILALIAACLAGF